MAQSNRALLLQLHEAALRFGDRTHKPADKPDTTFFFISPDGSFVKAYSGLSAPKEIAEDMSDYIVKYKRNNPTWHGEQQGCTRHKLHALELQQACPASGMPCKPHLICGLAPRASPYSNSSPAVPVCIARS